VPPGEGEALVARLLKVLDEGLLVAPAHPLEATGEVTTTHVLNLAVLSMGLARHLAFAEEEVMTLGLAALLHDVGRASPVNSPSPGAWRDSEAHRRRIHGHPSRGARILLDSGSAFAMAAIVAYEHHIGWQGTGGYPRLRFTRSPHLFSRIVSVCDVYDVLRTERPFRPALSLEAARRRLRTLAGTTIDPEIVIGLDGFLDTPHAWIRPPSSRGETELSDVCRLDGAGFDPDFESHPATS